MRIAFASEDFVLNPATRIASPGGCTYYRCLLPANAAGPHKGVGRPAWTGEHGFGIRLDSDRAQFGWDQVVMKQMMERWTPYQMRVAKDIGQRLIVDVDDAYYALHEQNRAYHTTDPSKNKIRNRAHLEAVIAEADVVTVSTPALFDYYSQRHPDVRIIRNGINPKQFTAKKQPNEKPIIGWAAALNWRSNDAEVLRGWLADFLNEHDLHFHHAGWEESAPSIVDVAQLPADRVSVSPMQPVVHYHTMLNKFDVGVIPLSNIPFNEAKSTIKGLEYAAAGIPWVASDLPEYVRLVDQGVGRVASTPQAWTEHLRELLDHGTRKREALRNTQLTLRDHTIESRAVEWAALFGEAYGRVVPVKTQVVGYGEA